MKKLCKNSDGKILCGVCKGIADYINLDVTIIRLLFVIFGFTSLGVILYIVAAIIMPEAY